MSSYVLLAGYAAGWAVVFGSFVSVYHRRKQTALNQLESWFPEHAERELYYELLDAGDQVPAAVLQSALIKRAVTDVGRAIDLQTKKQTLSALVKSGTIGDDVWSQFQAAEAELETEMMDLVQEANSLRPGWGQGIFQLASEMLGHQKIRELREKTERRAEGARRVLEENKDYYESLEAKIAAWKADEADLNAQNLIDESAIDKKKGLKKRK
ncbi:translocation protein Sec66 [Dimargaris cristalligena]|uniref:Pre protein translocase subunit Sec66-domain-containing protein n=1 Tax=Dimargaris cristalligena TaxID=215637 RepID=A0A4P9ZNI7_9FUNG|nr:translocation protein Sec66 [Dimargaris cristalligena]RKP34853.1 Pre protein translocase subunit Sec66-domain-containing protein [Dimargaris cristalligena]|eukprot:RKP34853.1 Pre protein translocase subunit Sec66-domain-containing protein [Dimargaris cristalligena]